MSTMMGGFTAQILQDQFLHNTDVAQWMDENVKELICNWFQDLDINMESITSGILGGLMPSAE